MSIIDEEYIKLINDAIEQTIANSHILNSKLYESVRYSLFSGGKRLRPMLSLKSYELFNHTLDKIIPFAVSIELIHTYSLINDDIPAMDDDDIRRGKPTNHKVFGEGVAILAGDSLLNLAFENILEYTYKNASTFEEYQSYIRATLEISKYSGCSGMIGGQSIDLVNTFDPSDEDDLISMYKAKTSGLIEAAAVSGLTR